MFPVAADPVGAGFVRSLARPGGNATGFMSFEYGIGGKWLELLKEIAPKVTRVAVLRDPAIASGIGIFGVMQAMAASLRMEVAQVNLRDPGEVTAMPDWHRGLRVIALLVTRAPGTGSHCTTDAAGLREALRQAAEE